MVSTSPRIVQPAADGWPPPPSAAAMAETSTTSAASAPGPPDRERRETAHSPGIWVGMGVFVGLRLIAVVARVRGDRWMVLGAQTPGTRALQEVDG